MSGLTQVAGYPVHAVAEYARWMNPHGTRFTTWRAVCGASRTDTGHGPFKFARQALRGELCPTCFPGRQHNASWHGTPVEVAREDLGQC